MPALKVWLAAIRPATLPAAAGPVAVGVAAGVHLGAFRPWVAAATMVTALLLQVAANLANDLSDFHRGADAGERLGPLRVTQAGLVSPERMRLATAVAMGLATASGLTLVAVGGWPILLAGLLALLATVTYTGGPWPYGYRALGEVFVFAFFGLVAVVGSCYLQVGRVAWPAVAAALPVACTVTAILVVNNLRDRAGDERAGKRTLAVLLGDRLTRVQYGVLMLAPVPLVGLAILLDLLPVWALLSLHALPPAVLLTVKVARGASGEELNRVLKRTAGTHLILSFFLALGLVW